MAVSMSLFPSFCSVLVMKLLARFCPFVTSARRSVCISAPSTGGIFSKFCAGDFMKFCLEYPKLRTALLWTITQRFVVIPYRHFGTTSVPSSSANKPKVVIYQKSEDFKYCRVFPCLHKNICNEFQ